MIKVTADGLAETVNVRQLGSEPAILISQQIFTVEASGSDIAFDVTTNVSVTITLPEWIKEKPAGTRASEMVTTTHNYIVTANPEDSERTGNITVKEVGGELEALVSVTQKGLGEYESGNLEGIKDDIKVPVESGEASSFQGGSNIDKSFDGDMSTIYHSNWNNAGDHYFPITLTYNFAAGSDMDYLIYYPRTSGPNGNFKEVEIRVKSNANTRGTDEWNTVMTKNFGGRMPQSVLIFRRHKSESRRFSLLSNQDRETGRDLQLVPRWNFIKRIRMHSIRSLFSPMVHALN